MDDTSLSFHLSAGTDSSGRLIMTLDTKVSFLSILTYSFVSGGPTSLMMSSGSFKPVMNASSIKP